MIAAKDLTIDDLNLYFHGTFVRLYLTKENSELFKNGDWVYIREFYVGSDDKDLPTPYAQITVKNHTRDVPLTHLHVEMAPPEVGHYNFKAGSVYYSRTTKRQNKKGICEGSATFSPFITFLSQHGGIEWPKEFASRNKWSLTEENLPFLFNFKDYPKKEDVYKDLLQGKFVSRALSHRILLSVGLKDSAPSVWLGKSYIGKLMNPSLVKIEVPALYEEARENLRPLGISLGK